MSKFDFANAKFMFETENAAFSANLIAKRNVAFVNRSATIVSETQVCKFKCTVCKRNASFVSEMHHL